MLAMTVTSSSILVTSTAGTISILNTVSRSYLAHWSPLVEYVRLTLKLLAEDPKFTQEAKDLVHQLILLVWAIYIDRHLEVLISLFKFFKKLVLDFRNSWGELGIEMLTLESFSRRYPKVEEHKNSKKEYWHLIFGDY
jgi:hypothetical protein